MGAFQRSRQNELWASTMTIRDTFFVFLRFDFSGIATMVMSLGTVCGFAVAAILAMVVGYFEKKPFCESKGLRYAKSCGIAILIGLAPMLAFSNDRLLKISDELALAFPWAALAVGLISLRISK
ncbi:MAG TPA: hypothetical protein PK683_11460 [Leptospiraceae bacterium]|nr:hypothetical protein [Leptospiraceae bacterium]HNH09111.1 hypothetical protein [Leptospiraceae bacterium]